MVCTKFLKEKNIKNSSYEVLIKSKLFLRANSLKKVLQVVFVFILLYNFNLNNKKTPIVQYLHYLNINLN